MFTLIPCPVSFNGGSALKAGGVAVSAVVSTQIGACCSGFVWLMLTWWLEKPSAVAVMNGAVAGLAGITPASGYINSPVRFLKWPLPCVCWHVFDARTVVAVTVT
jgi:ammonia channel protein AmtB